MKTDISWLKLAGTLADTLADNIASIQSLKCPNCGLPSVDYQYIGDDTTNIGSLCIWCTSCLHGKHISRVRIPLQADFISIDSHEELKKRIPNFK